MNNFPGCGTKRQEELELRPLDSGDHVVLPQLGLWGLTRGGKLVILDKLVSVSALMDDGDACVQIELEGPEGARPFELVRKGD